MTSSAATSMDSVSAVADSLRLQLQPRRRDDRCRAGEPRDDRLDSGTHRNAARHRTGLDGRRQSGAAAQHTAASSLLLDSLFAISSAIIAAEDARATAMLASADRIVTRQQVLVQSLLGIGLIAALIVGFATVRAVTRPLDMLATAAQARRRRESEGRHRPRRGLDEEYRVVAQALADTTLRLSQLVREIQSEARDVASAAGALTVASGAAAESTNRVSESMLHIASAAQEQRGAVETTHAVLARVRAASNVLESTASDAGALEGEVRQLTDGARLGIGEALDALARARDVIGASLVNVERVEKASAIVQQFLQTHPADLRADRSPRAQRRHRGRARRRERARIRRRRRRSAQARRPQQPHRGRGSRRGHVDAARGDARRRSRSATASRRLATWTRRHEPSRRR